jgi:adiponectin receptor
LDYAGISILIFGSVFPPLYYGFYCDAFLQVFYIGINGVTCISVYIISIMDFIHTEKWRRFKGIMYGSLGIFAGAASIHLFARS